jgi:hypothetical protein
MELPVTLRSSRRKTLLMLAGSLVFVAGGIWLLHDQPSTGYSGIAFFGLCAVVFCVQLLPNSSYLRLTAEGFTTCTLFRCHTVPWRHVRTFGVGRIGLKKVVGWDPAADLSGIVRATKAISGYASALPDTYGLRAEELAALLNRLRDEHAT